MEVITTSKRPLSAACVGTGTLWPLKPRNRPFPSCRSRSASFKEAACAHDPVVVLLLIAVLHHDHVRVVRPQPAQHVVEVACALLDVAGAAVLPLRLRGTARALRGRRVSPSR